jgi:hypothetical protein
MIRGVIPASGSAKRIRGIPKFALPISDSETLLEWHIRLLREVCDEVVVSTRLKWVPIVEEINVDAEVICVEPSTMNHSIREMSYGADRVVVAMPDTYFHNLSDNPYVHLALDTGDVTMAAFEMAPHLSGKVGQLMVKENRVLCIIDKDPTCDYDLMWGAFATNRAEDLNPSEPATGNQIDSWCQDGISVTYVPCAGTYIDAGTVEGLSMLYRSLDV